VLFAHFGRSTLWVFSTVLLQLEVPDQFRGRVFSAELALGVMFCVPALIWLLIESRWKDAAPLPSSATGPLAVEEGVLED
jgi:hypothetical protein